MRRRLGLVCLLALGVPGIVAAQDHAGHSQHAGEVDREVKALSDAEVAGLLAGEGMGYALAAELNRHPGPRHVLDLRTELALTEEQVEAVSHIFETMNARAREHGSRMVEAEGELDQLFQDGGAAGERMQEVVLAIAELEGELRWIHLEAHLRTTALLSEEQVLRYEEARGYVADHSAHDPD